MVVDDAGNEVTDIDELNERIHDLENRIQELEKRLEIEKTVPLKRLHPKATIPKYQNESDACFDLHALIDNDIGYIVVEPQSQVIVPTGISCSIPENCEIQVRPRSGLSAKFKITVTNSPGTVDEGYTIPNEIKIIIFNLSKDIFKISHGDRIAQGKLSGVLKAKFVEVDGASKEDKKRDRGGGFGSTGR